MKIKIAPSILSADFGRLNEEIASVEPYTDFLHFDVMDGHFVPNLSFGAPVLACLKTKLPVHCHLMVENPQDLLEAFQKAGAALVIVHSEVTDDLAGLLQKIRELGMKAGFSFKPGTDVDSILEFLPLADQVLVMSVEPGFGGQAFLSSALDKIAKIRAVAPNLDICVDGGINDETAPLCIEAGANILVAGSYIFKSKDRPMAISSLRP
jgi:ribulose-phosphate 3-epimerase